MTIVNGIVVREIEPLYVDVVEGEVAVRDFRFLLFGGGGMLGLVVAMLVFSNAVVDRLPMAGAIYQRLGIMEEKIGLEILNVRSDKMKIEGWENLIVVGEISNVKEYRILVPEVEIALRDGEKINIYQWNALALKRSLAGGRETSFSALVADYGNKIGKGAVDVSVKFAGQN